MYAVEALAFEIAFLCNRVCRKHLARKLLTCSCDSKAIIGFNVRLSLFNQTVKIFEHCSRASSIVPTIYKVQAYASYNLPQIQKDLLT